MPPQPMSEGLHREEARARLMPRAAPAVFDAIVAPLVASGRVTSPRSAWRSRGTAVSLSPEEARVREAVLEQCFSRPGSRRRMLPARARPSAAMPRRSTHHRPARAAASAGQGRHAAVPRGTARVAENGDTGVEDRRNAAPSAIDVASFKERYGITRKFAIPLLEYLDRERVTRRVGESRVLV